MTRLQQPNAAETRADALETACEGVVTSVKDGLVRVALQPNASCATCKVKGSCAMAAEGAQQIEVHASGFAMGEHVLVVSNPGAALATSTALYLIPTLLIITGSFAGFFAGPALLGLSGDLGALIGVVTGIVVSYLFIHFYRVGRAGGDPPVRLVRTKEHSGQ
jgi:positive regulator of sigma E activity